MICQFAANDPEDFYQAALHAQEMGCDGIDLNLGCPQRRAMENHYGSYMTDKVDWKLCNDIIYRCTSDGKIRIPITVKIRLQQVVEDTIAFAILLSNAGASLIAIHGRQRGCESQRRQGAADLGHVQAVVQALQAASACPVLTNGNVTSPNDVICNLAYTGADGIMIAEELLRTPSLFALARINTWAAPPRFDSQSIANTLVQYVEQYFYFLELYGGLVDTTHGIGLSAIGCKHAKPDIDLGSCNDDAAHPSVAYEMSPITLCVEDGSTDKKNGGKVKPLLPDERCAEEGERLPLWWNNTEVGVRFYCHCRLLILGLKVVLS